MQTAYFSSRGPTADGRIDPDITANGFASYVHAYLALTAPGGLADCREPGAVAGTCLPRVVFASGTSFSSARPSQAARRLAVARTRATNATADSQRPAESANPDALGDDSTPIDQGNGLLDVAAADARLATRHVSSQFRISTRAEATIMARTSSAPEAAVSFATSSGPGSASHNSRGTVTRRGSAELRSRARWRRSSCRATSSPRSFTVTIDRVTPELPPDSRTSSSSAAPTAAILLRRRCVRDDRRRADLVRCGARERILPNARSGRYGHGGD